MSMGLIDVIYNLVCDHTENGNWSPKSVYHITVAARETRSL